MATKRRVAAAPRSRSPRSTKPRAGSPPRSLAISPQTARSLLGVVLLVLGAVTIVALLFPAAGVLNGLVADVLRPAFGQGAWLMGILLLVAGAFVERAPNVGNGWGITAIGGLIVFLGGEGLIQLVWGRGTSPADLRDGGGALGHLMEANLTALVGPVGAFVVLLGIVVAGCLLLFNLTLRSLLRPVTATGRVMAGALTAPRAVRQAPPPGPTVPGPRTAVASVTESPGGRLGRRREPGTGPERPDAEPLPEPVPSPAPMSQTIWSASSAPPTAATAGAGAYGGPRERATKGGPVPLVDGAAANEAGASPSAVRARGGDAAPDALASRLERYRDMELPGLELLDPERPVRGGRDLDHARNVRIIEEKLRSFQIPAAVTGTNTGPVVTQYEVRPDVRVKLSRIEGLADDLAMALAARSIRIEAPIPGRDVVGIEIPNHTAEVVGFRQLIEDAGMLRATGKLTFALGRDVSGKAYAVDLAKMPHLLIAGATGSGKSVCINALITSLLMRTRPDEVRLVLIDLKRVELAMYEGLPHLLTNVIVEAAHARAALAWAVNQMEERYRLLASRGERNIAAFNASARVSSDERLPYIVLVIDELADLMMREGRKVEDPVVKLAQKARAVGIHLVLATQRPSVNVVTGLIKANVPSRIAFAMASNVDSRTVLDAPGAEDLIGRGDMLYQPADLPRPVRLQGVFVSDAEVHAVTDHWREQDPEPDYDPALLAAADEESDGGGQFGWLAKAAEDELTPRAAELVMQTGKASTSMMQTKLKVGFNRASRLMDELERFGIVGPQDPRNPAVPRQVYGPENWIRGTDDVDDL